jgi:hypothetical protein
MDDPSAQMLSWFEDDELTECPTCHAKTVVPADVGADMVLCTACGIVARPTPD